MDICSICKIEFEQKSKYYNKKTCSKSCFKILLHNNNIGKSYECIHGKEKAKEIINKKRISRSWYKHSEETKKKIGNANKKEKAQKIKLERKGKTYEELYSKEKAQLIKQKQKLKGGVTKKGKTYEELYGVELANKLKQNLHNKHFGKIFKRKCKGFYYNNQFFRSSWEKQFAIYCDNNNIRYQYEPNIFNLGKYRYIPDFYLPQLELWVEIKGWWKEQDKEKCQLFKQQITPRLYIIDRTNYKQIDNNYKQKDCNIFNLINEYNIPFSYLYRGMV